LSGISATPVFLRLAEPCPGWGFLYGVPAVLPRGVSQMREDFLEGDAYAKLVHWTRRFV